MTQSVTLKVRGLYTSDNDLSAVPEGALLKANNIVIDKTDIAEPRRGFDRLSAGFADSSYRANRLWVYQEKLFAHTTNNQVTYWDGAAWQVLTGTYTAPTSGKVYTAEANQNLYFTTNAGVKKLPVYNGTIVASGAYKGLDMTASTSSATPTFLTNNYRVAYRVVWGYRDSNNNLILGAPSQRESIKNTSGSEKSVSLVVTIPSGVTTSWFVQVYRSSMVDNSASTTEPSDEMQLVYEANPTSGEISAGSMTISDITPDSLKGATLYTSASQEGLANGNEQPPLCKDIAVFKGHTFFGNTTSKHRYYSTLLAVGGTSGIIINDTVTIGGITYTAKGTETAASAQFACQAVGFTDSDVDTGADTITVTAHGLSNDMTMTLTTSGTLPTGLATATTYYIVSATANTFKLSLSSGGAAVNITAASGGGNHRGAIGTGSAAQNIRDTAVSLSRVINRYSSSTVYAYYLSGSSDLPGKLLYEERSLGGAAFAVTASRGASWSPDLPTSGTTESSTNDAYANGLYFSKQNQPEAVPLTQFFTVGSKDKDILRIVPLRDSLFILKEDGIYRLTGENASSFSVSLLDSSTKLIGPETAAVLNNQIFCLSDQGVVTVSETGVSVISRPIEQDILALLTTSLSAVQSYSFGVSYETDRKYLLWTISTSSDTYATQCYVYNTFTNTWVRWELEKRCGVVSPVDDKLYLGEVGSKYVNKERKTRTYTDQVDYLSTLTISSVSVDYLTLTLSSGVDTISAGDVLYQSATIFSVVESTDTVANTVTMEFAANFAAGSVDVLQRISTEIQWVPATMGNPATIKHFHTAIFLFKTDFAGTATMKFNSDLSTDQESVTFTGQGIGNWGLFAWGSSPWGGTNQKRPVRTLVPLNKQVCSQLTVEFDHAFGYSSWQLAGVSLVAEVGGERITR
jgi:hypothetical protein